MDDTGRVTGYSANAATGAASRPASGYSVPLNSRTYVSLFIDTPIWCLCVSVQMICTVSAVLYPTFVGISLIDLSLLGVSLKPPQQPHLCNQATFPFQTTSHVSPYVAAAICTVLKMLLL